MDRRARGGARPRAGVARGRFAVVAVAVGVMLTAGACSSKAMDTAGSSSASGSGEAAKNAVPGAPAAGGNGSGGGELAAGASFKVDALNAPAAGSFISSATMTVEVDDVSDTKPKVVAVAIGAGGGLFGEQTTLGEKATSVITVKVPPEKFTKVLEDLAHLGALSAQEVKTDDVTKDVVDLDARIAAADGSLERTRALLDKAGSLPDIATLEGEIARRQADVESLRGQRKTLADRIALATIVVTLSNEKQATTAVAEQRRQDEQAKQQAKTTPGFGEGFEGGMAVARTVSSLALATLGAVLPFLPIILLLFLTARLRRSRQTAAIATLPPPPVPGGGVVDAEVSGA